MTPHQVNPVQLFNSNANALLLHRSSICAVYYPPQERRRHQVWDIFVVLPCYVASVKVMLLDITTYYSAKSVW